MFTSKELSAVVNLSHERGAKQASSRVLIIPTHNLILAALPRSEANKIVGASKPVRLSSGDVLYEAGDDIDFLYFPIDSVMSALAILEDGSSVEISMSGRESIVGLPALIGGGRALHWTRVSVGGTALRIPTASVKELFRNSEPTSEAIMRAYRSLFTQICQRSICNVRHTLLQRLSVWLLMVHDRVGSLVLPFTQEEIANRISVRRAGVSVAASMLQAVHAITYHRGKIVINDRSAIEQTACECYRVIAQDFDENWAETVGGGANRRF
jgi:CRP-like cAMP-binding protein